MIQQARLAAGISQLVSSGCFWAIKSQPKQFCWFGDFFPNERWEIFHKVSDIGLLLHNCTAKNPVSSKTCPNEQNTIPWDNKALGTDISHSKCGNVHCTCTTQSDPAQSPEHRLWVTPQPKVLMSSKMHKAKHLTKKPQRNAAGQTRTDHLGTPEVTWWKIDWKGK